MSIGVDLVSIPEFKEKARSSGFLEKVFLDSELRASDSPERLAGWFAAKEAFFKALGMKENWYSVWIEHDTNGKPKIFTNILSPHLCCSVSISRSGEYAMAVVVLEQARNPKS